MLAADKPEFARILNGLATIKPGAKLTAEGLELFWMALSSWSIQDFRAAAAQLARTSEFFPNPYHFEQLRKAGRLSAGEAWAEVRAIVRAGGEMHGDPVVDATVRVLGGYRALGMTASDQMQFLERRFAEHYEDIGDREDTREALPAIAGDPRARVCGPRSLLQVTDDSFNRPGRRS
jgi:hypothetical protein